MCVGITEKMRQNCTHKTSWLLFGAANITAPTLLNTNTFSIIEPMFLPLVLVELALYHQCIRVTDIFPPLVVQMHTGSTNNNISKFSFC